MPLSLDLVISLIVKIVVYCAIIHVQVAKKNISDENRVALRVLLELIFEVISLVNCCNFNVECINRSKKSLQNFYCYFTLLLLPEYATFQFCSINPNSNDIYVPLIQHFRTTLGLTRQEILSLIPISRSTFHRLVNSYNIHSRRITAGSVTPQQVEEIARLI